MRRHNCNMRASARMCFVCFVCACVCVKIVCKPVYCKDNLKVYILHRHPPHPPHKSRGANTPTSARFLLRTRGLSCMWLLLAAVLQVGGLYRVSLHAEQRKHCHYGDAVCVDTMQHVGHDKPTYVHLRIKTGKRLHMGPSHMPTTIWPQTEARGTS